MEGLSTTPLLSMIINAEGETSGGSAMIRGLELSSYTVTVVAETGAGEGDSSSPLAFTLMTSKITLYGTIVMMFGIYKRTQWNVNVTIKQSTIPTGL